MSFLGLALALSSRASVPPQLNDFAMNLVKSAPLSKTGNSLVSPLSVDMALSGLVPGSGRSDQALLLRTLSPGASASQMLGRRKNFIQSVDEPASPLKVANSVWVSNRIKVKPNYMHSLSENLKSEAKSFTASPASVHAINAWVSGKTKGRIPGIIDALRPEDVLLLINAVAFDGKWKTEFDPKLTKSQEFHAPHGNVQAQMMHLKAEVPYSMSATLRALKLPYLGGKFSMLLLLPANSDAVGLLKSLSPDAIKALSSTEASGDVTIAIPKFKFSNSYELKKPLASLGLGKLFDHADFSGISNQLADGQISRVVHKTFIEVDEKGTKAAAATGVMVRPTLARADEPTFIADRPFAFLILHEPTGSVVFAGVVNDPTKGG